MFFDVNWNPHQQEYVTRTDLDAAVLKKHFETLKQLATLSTVSELTFEVVRPDEDFPSDPA